MKMVKLMNTADKDLGACQYFIFIFILYMYYDVHTYDHVYIVCSYLDTLKSIHVGM